MATIGEDPHEPEAPSPKPSGAPRQDSLRDAVRAAKRRVESQLIKDALERHRWNRRRTAEALQISYRSLMYRMKSCNLRETAGGEPPEN
jgi:two-component system, NtrC family, response regulator AtoC